MTSTMLPSVSVSAYLAKRLRRVAKQQKSWTEERDMLVRQAVAEGGSLREVGELVGLSHSGVKRIVERSDRT